MRRDFEKIKPQLAVSDDGVRVYSSGMNRITVEYAVGKISFGCDPVDDADGHLELISDLIPGREWELLDGGKGTIMNDDDRRQAREDLEGGLTALGSRWRYRDEPIPIG